MELPEAIAARVEGRVDATEREILAARLEAHLADALRPLGRLYGARPDYRAWLRRMLEAVADAYAGRPAALKRLDLVRVEHPDWFQESRMMGYVCYVDRFAGDLRGVAQHIDYLDELGVTYLHLLPLLAAREGENDGGYAVIDYRRVEPRLGAMEDLAALAGALRERGISLCIDFVCNHTAREHPWARRAAAGDPAYQDYYLMFRDRELPERYERTLGEQFPASAPGNFSHSPELDCWVWTTFHEYQWDLNYANPAVFTEMLGNMLFLANRGAEILRLDAVAFMWKRMGTDSQNQPEVHWLLQAWRALTRIAAPALLLKAEAIVPPRPLVRYLGAGIAANKECELAYHNVLMAGTWSALASADVSLLMAMLAEMPPIPSRTAWITYLRVHDDIVWSAITDEDAAAAGLEGPAHRAWLAAFYAGDVDGSWARGANFQISARTEDRRTTGMLASLAGVEAALEAGDEEALALAVRRVMLLHAVVFAFGGIPVIYMGDELGLMNDRSYLGDPRLAGDGRWLHRPRMDWPRAGRRQEGEALEARIHRGLRALIDARRRSYPLHARASTRMLSLAGGAVLGLVRESARGRLLALASFSPERQWVSAAELIACGVPRDAWDWLLDRALALDGPGLALEPYQARWLGAAPEPAA